MQDATTSSLLKNAITAHKTGDLFTAEELYRQVLDASPNNVEALHYLGLLSLTMEQPEVTIALLKKAISIKGDNPDLLYNLGFAFQQINDIESAINYYKLAIAINPNFALAYNNLGVAYQHLGKLDLANEFLEKAFTYSPDCIEAYYNFAQSHKFSEKDNEKIEQIEQLLISKPWNTEKQIKLNFALGKIYDDLSIFKTAFNYYEKANELKNNDFNVNQFATYIDLIIENYNPKLIQLFSQLKSSSSRRLIFIVGMPRSGSTLVEQIIASHSSVQSAGESGFIGDIVDELPALLGADEAYPNCISQAKPEDLMQISTGVHSQVNSLPQVQDVITDKSPINFLHVGLILLLFPDSIIIHTKRNPIDTCLSCFFQNFDRQHQYSYDLKNLALFYNEYARLMDHWKSIFPTKIYDINYEDLIARQENESRLLINACELEWDDKCLEFHKSNSIVSTASKWQVRRPIYKTSVEKWKNYEMYIGDLINNLKT